MSLVEFKNLPDTTTPINAANLNNNFNELNSQISAAASAINNLKGTVLWTNSSPTSNYGATAVSINNLSNYDIIKIIFKRSTSSSIQFDVNLYLYEAIATSVATFLDGTTQYLRGISANKSTNKVSFERSQIPNVGFHDDTNIPICIIGYKNVDS